MHFLTDAAQAAQPDYIALAIVLVLLLGVVIMVLRKRFGAKKTVVEEAPVVEAPAPAAQAPTAPGSAGQVKLHDVAPKTAAMLMAITADKLGKPLNELRFISIEEVK